jgi:integrase/recombinase XerD
MRNTPKVINIYDSKTVTVEQGFKEFITFKKALNLSSKTIDYYNNTWNDFIKFSKVTDTSQINEQLIQQYILNFDQLKTKPVSINSYLRGIRTVLKYFFDRDYTKPFKVSMLKVTEEIKETYTESELIKLLVKPNTHDCTFNEYRSWTCINLFLATGARLGTVINLKLKDLDFDNSMITYTHTKNRKQQTIPMSKTLNLVLREYIQFRGASSEDDYLFCNVYGGKISERAIQQTIAQYNHSRGVNRTSIHIFRHTFAKMTVLAGIDPFRLQKILGHSCLDMTRKYCNMFSNDLVDGFNDYNPLEKFTKLKGNHIKLNK